MDCAHDLAEQEVACAADGLCPLCLREENSRLRDQWDKGVHAGMTATAEMQGRINDLTRERDEARAEVKKYHDALVARHGGEPVALLEELDASKAEIERLEGLILDWWDAPEGKTAETATALCIEARRIRAQRGQSKAHESDCPCVMCDPLQVRLSQQLRAQREEGEPLCDGSCGAKPDRPHRHFMAKGE